jgi:hypothetical protein
MSRFDNKPEGPKTLRAPSFRLFSGKGWETSSPNKFCLSGAKNWACHLHRSRKPALSVVEGNLHLVFGRQGEEANSRMA